MGGSLDVRMAYQAGLEAVCVYVTVAWGVLGFGQRFQVQSKAVCEHLNLSRQNLIPEGLYRQIFIMGKFLFL